LQRLGVLKLTVLETPAETFLPAPALKNFGSSLCCFDEEVVAFDLEPREGLQVRMRSNALSLLSSATKKVRQKGASTF